MREALVQTASGTMCLQKRPRSRRCSWQIDHGRKGSQVACHGLHLPSWCVSFAFAFLIKYFSALPRCCTLAEYLLGFCTFLLSWLLNSSRHPANAGKLAIVLIPFPLGGVEEMIMSACLPQSSSSSPPNTSPSLLPGTCNPCCVDRLGGVWLGRIRRR